MREFLTTHNRMLLHVVTRHQELAPHGLARADTARGSAESPTKHKQMKIVEFFTFVFYQARISNSECCFFN